MTDKEPEPKRRSCTIATVYWPPVMSLVKSFIETENPNAVPIGTKFGLFLFGDPYGTRTHVTAVKGRCLNLLTNGPGSGNLTRTDDTPGMNRMLYQLSYAAICSPLGTAR